MDRKLARNMAMFMADAKFQVILKDQLQNISNFRLKQVFLTRPLLIASAPCKIVASLASITKVQHSKFRPPTLLCPRKGAQASLV
jgi:hypothetical protein